jgi:type II secretory pathway component PulF
MAHSVMRAWNELDVARYKSELYRMWHAGYRAGLSHERVLSTAGEFRRSPTVARMRRHLLRAAQQREGLATPIKARPDLFVPFEAALLELGEEAGGLEEILQLLGTYFQNEHRMTLWVKKKMAYPMMNAIGAIFIAPFPVLFFGNAAAYALTVTTSLVVALAAGGALLAAAARSYRNRPKIVLARLCRAMAVGVEAGLSLDRVVQLAVDATGSRELAGYVARIPRPQLRSQPLAATFSGSALVSPEMVAALQVAEETGDYTNTLKKLAELYEDGFK